MIISAVLENEQSKVALYNKEYELLLRKEGLRADALSLCLDMISVGGMESCDADYIGIAMDTPAPLAAEIEKSTGIKCYEVPLITARALGEAYIANDVPFLVLLKADDTVECGIVINKKAYAGANIAHTVIGFGGYECTCQRRGCFQAYASNAGLQRIAAESGVEDAEVLTHTKLYAMKTPEAENAKRLYVEYLASGIVDIINLFQPNELVLEGPFTEVGDALMIPLMDIILREQYTRSIPNKCNVRFQSTDRDTALLGAALLGR
ncbi:MAG: ROK family protein [Clostridia bacterium]|nr:ROK family protein [Clostridia bacterium]